jgi:preprotein translocase subunit SecA
VKAAGGLAIIGTERHESRRVDRQLRGRAGRQGDPGSSVFFVSLEDDLMRLFASDKISRIMDKLGFEEGEMIEHNMISNAIERAQKKVEENNFGIRKHLLEYDDVMNSQREVIYTKRRHALMGERIGVDIMNMIYDAAAAIVEEYGDNVEGTFEDMKMDVLQVFAMEMPFTAEDMKSMKAEEQVDALFDAALKAFKSKSDLMAETANPVIEQVYENQGAMYENILIPITDGKRMYNVSCNLKEAYETKSKSIAKAFHKQILLHTIDEGWKENLLALDELRQSVRNASYEQKDPLVIYKLESYKLFKAMIDKINRKTVKILMRGRIPVRQAEEVREAAPEQHQDYSRLKTEKQQIGGTGANAVNEQEPQKQEPVQAAPHIGRNEPCPCGSGKKYKNCHGRSNA